MNASETELDSKPKDTARRDGFTAVHDKRNRRVRGLWERNGRFYAQLRYPEHRSPRRVPLVATTLAEAKAEYAELMRNRRLGDVPAPGRKPLFRDVAEEYISFLRTGSAS